MIPFAPILIGAAVGAGTSALFGGNPLRGGLLGGLSGGLFGGGGWLEELLKKGAASGLQTAGTAAGAANTAQTAAQLAEKGISSGLPIQGFAGTPSGVSPMTAALEQAALRDPTGFASGINSLPAEAAVPFGGSTGAKTIADQGLLGSLKDYMPSAQSVGKLALDTTGQTRAPIMAPAGGISQGKAPDIAAVEQLLKRRPRPQQSLLTDYFG